MAQLANRIGMGKSTIKYHLKQMKEMGLVSEKRGIYHSFWEITKEGRAEIEKEKSLHDSQD
jgi:DNA-binding MarR family transcriptional regulator